MTLLVLYEELADYFVKALTHFCVTYDVEAVVIHKKQNPVAPFQFTSSDRIKLIPREGLQDADLAKIAQDLNPSAFFCGGWAYPAYIKLCKKHSAKLPVILGFDNWWDGSPKQKLATIYFKLFYKKAFNKAFVPGKHQLEFARKLGFSDDQIGKRAYCCDYDLFSEIHDKRVAHKAQATAEKKVLLYMGRYSEEKGITQLWNHFSSLAPDDWELWCMGKGHIEAIDHPNIKHLGFVHPNELDTILVKVDAFVLPSYFEPWGVVVHELASVGIPILSSKYVGASEVFVEPNLNGLLFDSRDNGAFKAALQELFSKNNDELEEWGKHSRKLSSRITNEVWSKTLKDLITRN